MKAKPNKIEIPKSIIARDLQGVPTQVLDDFFGIWAIEETRFRQAVDKFQGINLVAHIEANRGQVNHLTGPVAEGGDVQAASDERRLFSMTGDGVAVINLRGPMMKYYTSMSDNASTVFARRQVRQAADDDAVGSILLVIDSPGGTVAGTMDLAAEVAKANKRKPVVAFLEDLTASAAYWVASQARSIYANNATALVGSIGTYAVLYDYSKAAEQLGVKVHLIKAGEFKGTGVQGTEITEPQIAEMQRIVDSLNSEFLSGVASGRGLEMSVVKGIADGRVHPAAEAVGLKLVDAIKTFEETVADLSQSTKKRRSYAMTQDMGTSATLQELKAAIPDADPAFLVAQLEANATVGDALKSFAAKIKADNDRLQKEKAELEAKHKTELEEAAAKAKADAEQKAGVEPLGAESTLQVGAGDYAHASGDPIADFDGEVRRRMQQNPHLGRQSCVLAAARANPALHQAFLVATNPSRKAGRLLTEKYEDATS